MFTYTVQNYYLHILCPKWFKIQTSINMLHAGW